jgi:hypothetical protein
MRGTFVTANQSPLENLNNQPRYFSPDVEIFQAGIFIIVNSTDFMIKWDGSKKKINFYNDK